MTSKLGAVLIVRNEAQTIERCLASARAAGVSTFTIVDTGSTDGTQDILISRGLRWQPRAWHNFGYNRSEAFALARGTADWLLALDADMTVEWDEGWTPDPSVDAYMLEMGSGDFSYRLPLLLRGDLPWVSRGAVHEYTALENGSLGRREPTDHVRITHHGEGRSTPEKSLWHAQLLEAELDKHPNDPRTVFYLARTYSDLDDPRAAGFYGRRASMGGWEEERWYAQYRAALLEEWPARATQLLSAWEARPHRLEPLCAVLRDLNARSLHQSAYLLSGAVSQAHEDILFVDRSVEWRLSFERSIAAWHTGHRDEFRRLSEWLLSDSRVTPDVADQVVRNLAA